MCVGLLFSFSLFLLHYDVIFVFLFYLYSFFFLPLILCTVKIFFDHSDCLIKQTNKKQTFFPEGYWESVAAMSQQRQKRPHVMLTSRRHVPPSISGLHQPYPTLDAWLMEALGRIRGRNTVQANPSLLCYGMYRIDIIILISFSFRRGGRGIRTRPVLI
jgi:hypothetical protein